MGGEKSLFPNKSRVALLSLMSAVYEFFVSAEMTVRGNEK